MAIVTADRLGKGIRTAPRDALISLSTPRDALGAAFGVHRAMDAAGAMIGPLAAVAVLTLAPRRFDLVFVVSFALGIVGLSVLVLFVRTPPLAPSDEGDGTAQHRLFPATRGLWLTLAGGGLLSLLTISDGFVYLVVQRRGLISADTIPLLYAGTNVTYLLLAAPLGALSDRMPRWQVYALGHLCLALVYGVLLASGGSSVTVLVVLALLGAYYAATEGVLAAMVSAVVPRSERGSGLGLLSTATSVGRMGASLAFGWAWTAWGDAAALAAFAATLPVGLLVAGVLLSRAQQEIISA
jgi:MFS family permease